MSQVGPCHDIRVNHKANGGTNEVCHPPNPPPTPKVGAGYANKDPHAPFWKKDSIRGPVKTLALPRDEMGTRPFHALMASCAPVGRYALRADVALYRRT